jgi:hypothetical protein
LGGYVEQIRNADGGDHPEDENNQKSTKPERREDAPPRVDFIPLDLGLLAFAAPRIAIGAHRIPPSRDGTCETMRVILA